MSGASPDAPAAGGRRKSPRRPPSRTFFQDEQGLERRADLGGDRVPLLFFDSCPDRRAVDRQLRRLAASWGGLPCRRYAIDHSTQGAPSLPLAVGALSLSGLGTSSGPASFSSLLQAETDPSTHGRVFTSQARLTEYPLGVYCQCW